MTRSAPTLEVCAERKAGGLRRKEGPGCKQHDAREEKAHTKVILSAAVSLLQQCKTDSRRRLPRYHFPHARRRMASQALPLFPRRHGDASMGRKPLLQGARQDIRHRG